MFILCEGSTKVATNKGTLFDAISQARSYVTTHGLNCLRFAKGKPKAVVVTLSYEGLDIRRYAAVYKGDKVEVEEQPCLFIPQTTKFETSFTVMPKDCNWVKNKNGLVGMLFGGALMSQMDIAAAMAVRRSLYGTGIENALTVGVTDVAFFLGAKVGDLVHLNAYVTKFGIKSIAVKVDGTREDHNNGKCSKICTGLFTFVSVDDDEKAIRHNLQLVQ